MLQIPLTNDDLHYRVDVQLEGTTYSLDMDWNDRAGLWFLSLGLPTAEGTTSLMRACACVVGLPLTLGLVSDDWTGGALVIEGDRDPERYDWGTHARLYYASRAELVAVRDAAL